MQEKNLFEERQYLGLNKSTLARRLLLALFCFVAYYWSENPKPVEVISGIEIVSYPIEEIPNSGELFFVLGVFIIVLSVVLAFVPHIRTVITPNYILLEGFWTSRKVKITLNNISTAKRVRYSKYNLNRPVYNMHNKGVIKFYTSGNDAIELIDNEGLKYKIGTQKPETFLFITETLLKNSRTTT
ncbi:MAG: hypothetical protein J0M08_00930 [Bacteroidetes bacterium]|nr:hypothetical protein [Bacteroidota bacterium]